MIYSGKNVNDDINIPKIRYTFKLRHIIMREVNLYLTNSNLKVTCVEYVIYLKL